MSAGPFVMHHSGLLGIVDGTIDFVNDVIKAVLLDNAHAPDEALEDNLDDLTANEIADADYARQTVIGKSISLVSGRVRIDAGIVNFGENVTIAARYMYLIKDTGTAATSRIVGHVDLNYGGAANVSVTNSAFKVDFSANGAYELVP